MSKIDELKKLKTLLDEGAISEDEFNSLKMQIINDKEDNMSSAENKKNHVSENTSSRTSESFDNNANSTSRKNSQSEDSITTENQSKLKLLFSGINYLFVAIVPIIIFYRYDFSLTTLVIAVIVMWLIYLLNKIFEKQNKKLSTIILTSVLALFILIPIGTDSDSSSNNSDSSSTTNTESEKAWLYCGWCGQVKTEEEGKDGIFCYTNKADGVGMMTFYEGTRSDVYCSEKCALSAHLAGYSFTAD